MAMFGKSIKSFQRLIPRVNTRFIATGEKTNKAASAKAAECSTTTPAFQEDDTNWVSYGYSYTDKNEDRAVTHLSFFGGISLLLVLGSWWFLYSPDIKLKAWSQREAFIELHRREKAGLPLIDPNIIDPKCMKLPSESELKDVEIII